MAIHFYSQPYTSSLSKTKYHLPKFIHYDITIKATYGVIFVGDGLLNFHLPVGMVSCPDFR